MKRNKQKSERGEAIRAYFVRLFGKYDFRNEQHFLHFGKWLIFIVLLLVEGLALLQQIDLYLKGGGWLSLLFVCCVISALTLSMALQLFVVKGRGKITFYVFEMLASCAFLSFADELYSLILYMLVLTQVYFEAKRPRQSVGLLVLSVCIYVVSYGTFSYAGLGTEWRFLKLLRQTASFIVSMVTHFFIIQIALAFYRQYAKLHETLEELDESKKELEKAYAVVAEVSALEERQRIAKEIHDTVGHSLTTVIMQTEAASRIVEDSPAEAKSKLIAANLRARQALEEIRSGVHLLSGASEGQTLQRALLAILHETTDGTGITVRSEIEDVEASPAKRRFLCNGLKEGISNGLRHGNATAFWFELKRQEGELRFLLSDNGSGAKGELTFGFGLTAMEERARAFGGEIRVRSDEEEGFELYIRLPVDNAQGGVYEEN